MRLLMPAGISFYTFTTLSYLIDAYRGTIKPELHFGYYALYVSYFPHIMSGPIARAGKLIPQFKAERRFDREGFLDGLGIVLVGFFKKIAIADVISVYVNAVYGDAEASNGLALSLATILYALQIYCDFSGYTDIAIGCACMMGIELMQNFNLPYSAVSIKDFWARWHISLSTWFRDYIYIPLGGNRRGKLRKHINVMIVFSLSLDFGMERIDVCHLGSPSRRISDNRRHNKGGARHPLCEAWRRCKRQADSRHPPHNNVFACFVCVDVFPCRQLC